MKLLVGIIFLIFSLSSLGARIQPSAARRHTFPVKRCHSSFVSQQKQPTRKLTAPNNSVIQLFTLLHSFVDACYDHYKAHIRDKREPEIQCKNCKKKVMTYSEFTRRLIAEAWDKAAGDSSCVRENMTEFIKITSEKSDLYTEMVNFMIRSSKELELDCYQCGGILWENA